MREKVLRKGYVFILVVLILFMYGCQRVHNPPMTTEELLTIPDDEEISLWIVTEKTTADGMNAETQKIIKQFKNQYINANIRLDILPTSQPEREQYLEQLHLQDEEGLGPDIFLLPTSNVLVIESEGQYSNCFVDPLFSNVDVAMREDQFLDINGLYSADQALNKENLVDSVMGAGVVGDARYVVPLRFNLPVLYSFSDEIEKHGVDPEYLNTNIDEWMDYVISKQDPVLACGAEYRSFNAFSHFINYEKEEVELRGEDLSSYMLKLQKIEALVGNEAGHRSYAWIDTYVNGLLDTYPARIGPLSEALTYVAISKAEEKELTMHPVRTADGDYVATVSYYGAIGKNCTNPTAAYLFLRMFLLEESQWEINRSENCESQYSGLLEQSWPVRALGSVEPLWENQKKQVSILSLDNATASKKSSVIRNVEINQEDIEILNIAIDIARFPLPFDRTMRGYLSQMNAANSHVDDISHLAELIISDLEAEIAD